MKKAIILGAFLSSVLFLVGCSNYKKDSTSNANKSETSHQATKIKEGYSKYEEHFKTLYIDILEIFWDMDKEPKDVLNKNLDKTTSDIKNVKDKIKNSPQEFKDDATKFIDSVYNIAYEVKNDKSPVESAKNAGSAYKNLLTKYYNGTLPITPDEFDAKKEKVSAKGVGTPKNISGILKTVSSVFNPYGLAVYDEVTDNIVVNLNVDDSKYSSDEVNKFREQLKLSAKTAYDTVKKVYHTENNIVIKNSGKELFTVKSGEIQDK